MSSETLFERSISSEGGREGGRERERERERGGGGGGDRGTCTCTCTGFYLHVHVHNYKYMYIVHVSVCGYLGNCFEAFSPPLPFPGEIGGP